MPARDRHPSPLDRRLRTLLSRWLDGAYWSGRDLWSALAGPRERDRRTPTAQLSVEPLERRALPTGFFTFPSLGHGGTEVVSPQIVFTVQFQGMGNASVDYTTRDRTPVSASAGNDYTAISGTLNFTGPGSQTLTVTILSDNYVEPTEYFDLVLSNPVNATISSGTDYGIINDYHAGGSPGAFQVGPDPNSGPRPSNSHMTCGFG